MIDSIYVRIATATCFIFLVHGVGAQQLVSSVGAYAQQPLQKSKKSISNGEQIIPGSALNEPESDICHFELDRMRERMDAFALHYRKAVIYEIASFSTLIVCTSISLGIMNMIDYERGKESQYYAAYLIGVAGGIVGSALSVFSLVERMRASNAITKDLIQIQMKKARKDKSDILRQWH